MNREQIVEEIREQIIYNIESQISLPPIDTEDHIIVRTVYSVIDHIKEMKL